MKRRIRRQLEQRKRKIEARLAPLIGGAAPRVPGQPELSQQRGQVLQDIEHRRNDATFLDALGARAIPDPTTAGDYCRRFDAEAVWRLTGAINDVRLEVWRKQPQAFTQATARLDVDGTLVGTTGECKEGMDLSYKGDWGYHPLLVSLANTHEPLFLVNRPGSRPSHEGAPAVIDRAIALCRQAGFRDILVRGEQVALGLQVALCVVIVALLATAVPLSEPVCFRSAINPATPLPLASAVGCFPMLSLPLARTCHLRP